MRPASQAAIDRSLEELMSRPATKLDVAEIAEIVRGIVGTLHGDLTAGEAAVYSELDGLAQIIRNAKAEIAEIRPDEISSRHLPVAQDELDAVVSATEAATHSIMAAAEKIEATAAAVGGEHADALSEAVTNIYEACGFQDITGQRITKVVRTLHQIEAKVAALLAAFGDEIKPAKPAAPQETAPADGAMPRDKELLNGPQLPAAAISQDDIDAILSGKA
ncbi:MAG: protein phosphatase CheZ [Alphaproteobacteria bacterium]|nr:protein phosphatase CheZ [Alphaproteobacteria bacterium]